MAGEHVKVRHGFFPLVTGSSVSVRQAGAAAIVSRGDTDLTQGGAQVVVGGGSTSIHQGGANLLVSGGDVSVTQGGTLVAAARSIGAEQSYLGVVIGSRVDLTDCTVLVGPRQAALFGAVAGAVTAYLVRQLRR